MSDEQLDRIKPYFPQSHGVPRVDDHRVVSGIVFVIRNGLRWRDAPKEYGPHKTLYNRFIRWSRMGVFDRIFANLAGQSGKPDRLIIDATHLKAHRTAASLFKKGLFPAASGARKAYPRLERGGLNSKLHAVTDGNGKPLILLLSEGQMSDHKGARLMLDALPQAKSLTGDRGYDSDWFRKALIEKGIDPCIPPKKNRKIQHAYDKALYKKRHKIENAFGWLKDWRRIATRYDRCAHAFFSSICIAVSFIFYLR